jgi:hypothetical protein
MPERLFLFLQLEFPWDLGPPDGRYLLRTREAAGPEAEIGEPEHVVVLDTLGARRRTGAVGWWTIRLPGSTRRARAPRRTTGDPAPVPTARATIIDPVSVSAKRQAQTWLAGIDTERETQAALKVLNRVLFAHRIATADPHTHEVAAAQALMIRAGWGEGKQLADGYWQHARELPWSTSPRSSRRAAVLRPDERLAELLGARSDELLCEEFALRARLDLDHGRLAHAAIELDTALTAALSELVDEQRPDLTPRVAELEALRPGVMPKEPDEEVVRYTLERLEAALRARTAAGFATTK